MERKILQNKIFLYLTEFFSGMSVMAVELGASRMLAPFFSSSQIVWTIIIGTIMIAMALGNLWGGRSADRNPDPDRLYLRILLASVWIACIPLLGKYIIAGVTMLLALFVTHNFLIWAAFLSCMVLFVFPLLLLGTVTPSLAKFTVGSLEDSGKIVGTLGALNTIGSILGTFLPTFVTIPAVGTSVTFLIFAGILLALCLVYFLSRRQKKTACAIAAILFLCCCIWGSSPGFAFWEKNLLVEEESVYNYLQVKETDQSIILSTNVMFGVQSIKMKDDGLTGMYYDYAMAAPLLAGVGEDSDGNVLVLGMGTGTYASQCLNYFSRLRIEGVEIDSKITDLAHRYFDLPQSVPVATDDGRAFLQSSKQKYDVILVDAYQDITIPFQLSTVEFFTLVKEHLKDGGVMVVNMNMYSGHAGSINEYLSDTIRSVFPEVYTVQVSGNTNCELFACNGTGSLETFHREVEELDHGELRDMMETVEQELTAYAGGDDILTDDKAPVEMLGMKMIDELIHGELNQVHELFRTEGIRGLMKLL